MKYIVGLIDNLKYCRTFQYASLEEAKKELHEWKNIFMNNNVVLERTTIINRDVCDNISSVKHCFMLKDNSNVILFLSKNEN